MLSISLSQVAGPAGKYVDRAGEAVLESPLRGLLSNAGDKGPGVRERPRHTGAHGAADVEEAGDGVGDDVLIGNALFSAEDNAVLTLYADAGDAC